MGRYSTVFLDLDDTLYPSDNGVWDAIGDRINLFMVERLSIDPDEVRAVRDEFLRSYGTTLHGLMVNYNADPHEYLDFVHDIPLEDYLLPNPELKHMLQALPLRRIVFTNASTGHANRVLRRLGVENQIDAIVDLLVMNLSHKPQKEAYQIALAAAEEKNGSACLLVDDRIENLIPGASFGMTTVLVGRDAANSAVDFRIETITDLIDAVPDLRES
jgi:pyrimidine 5'-nucleotidase